MVPLSLSDRWIERIGEPRMGLVIRIERHLSDDPDAYIDDAWAQRASAVEHGGDAGEELAALLSLAMGIRLRAGGIARVFSSDNDDRGLPHEVERSAPYLPHPARGSMLPYTRLRPTDLSRAAKLLDIYPHLSVHKARASRAFLSGRSLACRQRPTPCLAATSHVNRSAGQTHPGGTTSRNPKQGASRDRRAAQQCRRL